MIKLLDCTLRDGGYVNNWEFGRLTKQSILTHLVSGNIDIIECGFVSQKKQSIPNNSIYLFPHNVKGTKGNSLFAVMVNHGEYKIDEFEDKNENNIDIVRYAFHKKDYIDAIECCKVLISKGYKVFLQPMNTMSYSKEEYEDLIKRANKLDFSAFYIVDSFGNMKRNDVKRFYTLATTFLKDGAVLGFHSHNNLQLSFSNSLLLMSLCTDRELILDSTLLGMGRGAGNLCTELIAQHLNNEFSAQYNLIPLLESIDSDILPIRQKNEWGYSIPYYLASINDCHPNYATFLIFKHTLSVNEINTIITSIPFDKKQNYDEEYIAKLYKDYQSKQDLNKTGIKALEESIAYRKVLIIAPGKSVSTEKNKINDFINANKPVVISINGKVPFIKEDFVFISNKNRFDHVEEKSNLITTSNINFDNGIRVNYADLLSPSNLLMDNAGLMCIKLMTLCKPSIIYLAGFDGYSFDDNENYYDEKYKLIKNQEQTIEINNEMEKEIKRLSNSLENDIVFVTKSLYE